jgi:hypothetical protein
MLMPNTIDTSLLASLVQQLDSTLQMTLRLCREVGVDLSEEQSQKFNLEMRRVKDEAEHLANHTQVIMFQANLALRSGIDRRQANGRAMDFPERRTGQDRRIPPLKKFVVEPRWRCGYCGERNLPAYLAACDKCRKQRPS